MEISGIIIGIAAFLIIGFMHPVVIKGYYYFGLHVWLAFLVIGIICLTISLLIPNLIASVIVAVLGISFLWGIKELFEQRQRIIKGWYPPNPKRAEQVALASKAFDPKTGKAVPEAQQEALSSAIDTEQPDTK